MPTTQTSATIQRFASVEFKCARTMVMRSTSLTEIAALSVGREYAPTLVQDSMSCGSVGYYRLNPTDGCRGCCVT